MSSSFSSPQCSHSPISALALVLAIVMVAACGGGAGSQGTGSAEGAGEPAAQLAEKTFDEAVEDQECTLLTLDEAASLTGVPADELEQMEVSGCVYSWSDGSIYLNVSVYDTVERAESWFERFTQSATAEEIAQAQEEMSDRLDEMQEEGELDESDRQVAGALTDAMPQRAVTEESIDGLGNEASLENSGSLRVRYGNLTFEVVARRGPDNDDDPELAIRTAEIVVGHLEQL